MYHWNIPPGQLVFIVFTLCITSFSITTNGEPQSGWMLENRPDEKRVISHMQAEEPYFHFTTTEDPFDESETTEGGLNLETTRKNVSQISFGRTSGHLKNGTVSSPECVYTKEEAYCQRVLIIAILLVTCTIVSSIFILCLLQYFHLRKYTFYFNDAILPHQGNSTCTTLNGVTVKEVAI
ncbi:hypothetical protein LSTR_LSTR000580 [Laodelphax striatellus]|uniref:Uncharacterized protein n=1 Tax=Laodelphax striatellus TaxID=195883 RepID=A0A482XH33_LAOST|nr:hypothetical protein LSTR_LSTR000580 [Laodelphax striatellus]